MDVTPLPPVVLTLLVLFLLGVLVASALAHRRLLGRASRVAAAHAFLTALLEHLPDAALVVDAAGRVVRANGAARRLLGDLSPPR